MTQVNGTQPKSAQFALPPHATLPTLAQRRASFEAQMRAMALADLQEVAGRLKLLHKRLNRKTAHEWTLLEIAQGAKVAPRTFQTWVGARNENSDGTGYEKLARFYRRKLGDKTITKEWIVFGEESAEEAAPDLMNQLSDNGRSELRAIGERLSQIEKDLGEVHRIAKEWLAERDAAFARQDEAQQHQPGTEQPAEAKPRTGRS